jgi:phosphoesterase RecJ-like protein
MSVRSVRETRLKPGVLSADDVFGSAEIIRHCDHILCTSHINPDGDAVGSVLAMGAIVRALGKRPTLALQDPVPVEYQWMPGLQRLVTAERLAAHYDLIICLDASSSDRMGEIYRPEQHASTPLLVIDHHATNTRFGDINWVEAQSAATCQMLLELAETLAIPIESDLATCLLTGLVTDTLGFRTSNTTPAVLDAALRLMHSGANLPQIAQLTLDVRPFTAVKLAGLALANAQMAQGVVWAAIPQTDIKRTGGDPHATNLNSILSRVVEADISAVFIEKFNEIGMPSVDCSFRAKNGFDVGRVALNLGGGGHRAAAGCKVAGDLHVVVGRVVQLLQEEQRRSAQAQQQSESGRGGS